MLLLLALPGCRLFTPGESVSGRSPLLPGRPAPDSVTMEIFWARYTWGDEELNGAVWNHIDESQIPAILRRELAANGLRAGVVGSLVPDAIARALRLDLDSHRKDQDDQSASPDSAELLAAPKVTRRLRQLRRGVRLELQATKVHDELPLLVTRNGELGGGTYADAQAIYAVKVDPQADRTVHLQVTPELHYGQPKLEYTSSDDGVILPMPRRDREVFSQLRIDVTLAAGEMLVLAGHPDAGSRLGHCFHACQSTSGREQKLMIVRLAEVPPSETFAE